MTTELSTVWAGLTASGTYSQDAEREFASACSHLLAARLDELEELCDLLCDQPPPPLGSPAESRWRTGLGFLAQRFAPNPAGDSAGLNERLRGSIAELYLKLTPDSSIRHLLLVVLAGAGTPADLPVFADLVADDPPTDWMAAGVAFSPLMRRDDCDGAGLFPRLLDALAHPQVAPLVLDLANYLARSGQAIRHPATDHAARLMSLLEQLAARLESLGGQTELHSSSETQRQVGESVALACGLCDALALIGQAEAIPLLERVSRLPHRRLRAEAAAALARLGEAGGAETLVTLAAHPIARLRVLTYAAELGLEERIDPDYATPAARAEAELATWLAEPSNLGSPPTATELIDARRQFWPSFDDPVDCFLFRFAYRLPQGEYENVGIAGPLVHAFLVDMTRLTLGDQYAAFAGWQTEHAEIAEIPAEEFTADQHDAVAKITIHLAEQGFSDITPVLFGLFFGEWPLVAVARYDGTFGSLVAGREGVQWFPQDTTSSRPLGPHEAYSIWKGRHLLAAFNEV